MNKIETFVDRGIGVYCNTYQPENYKSTIQIGNITIYCTKKFNWFNKLMMKLIFGWEVKDCGSND